MNREALNREVDERIASKTEINSISPEDVSICILLCADYFDANKDSLIKPSSFTNSFDVQTTSEVYVRTDKGKFIFVGNEGIYTVYLEDKGSAIIDTVEVLSGEKVMLIWDGSKIDRKSLDRLSHDFINGASKDRGISQYAANELYKLIGDFISKEDIENVLSLYVLKDITDNKEVTTFDENIYIRGYDVKEDTDVKISAKELIKDMGQVAIKIDRTSRKIRVNYEYNKVPNIMVVLNSGERVEPIITYIDESSAMVSWDEDIEGTIYIN